MPRVMRAITVGQLRQCASCLCLAAAIRLSPSATAACHHRQCHCQRALSQTLETRSLRIYDVLRPPPVESKRRRIEQPAAEDTLALLETHLPYF